MIEQAGPHQWLQDILQDLYEYCRVNNLTCCSVDIAIAQCSLKRDTLKLRNALVGLDFQNVYWLQSSHFNRQNRTSPSLPDAPDPQRDGTA